MISVCQQRVSASSTRRANRDYARLKKVRVKIPVRKNPSTGSYTVFIYERLVPVGEQFIHLTGAAVPYNWFISVDAPGWRRQDAATKSRKERERECWGACKCLLSRSSWSGTWNTLKENGRERKRERTDGRGTVDDAWPCLLLAKVPVFDRLLTAVLWAELVYRFPDYRRLLCTNWTLNMQNNAYK